MLIVQAISLPIGEAGELDRRYSFRFRLFAKSTTEAKARKKKKAEEKPSRPGRVRKAIRSILPLQRFIRLIKIEFRESENPDLVIIPPASPLIIKKTKSRPRCRRLKIKDGPLIIPRPS